MISRVRLFLAPKPVKKWSRVFPLGFSFLFLPRDRRLDLDVMLESRAVALSVVLQPVSPMTDDADSYNHTTSRSLSALHNGDY